MIRIAWRPVLLALALATGCGVPVEPPTEATQAAVRDAPPPLGSERGSVVAIETAGGTRGLVYLTSQSAGDVEPLRAAAPNVRFITDLDRESALEHAAVAHGADAHLCTPELLSAAPELRWVQSWSAGVERYMALEALRESEAIVLTNMKGVHGPAIADHVFAMLLSLTRNIDSFRGAKDEGRWDRALASSMTSLHGKTMLVVGLGGIGHHIARRADGFGMTVLATARTPREAPAYVDHLGVAGELDTLLPRADVVALAVPLTAETEDLFDGARFRLMKFGSYLINIARGKVVDTPALLAALDEGRLAGAGLDVTDPEPLPPEHPLWGYPNVVITPHVAARAEVALDRRTRILEENLRRFGAGEPLLNVVDREAGY